MIRSRFAPSPTGDLHAGGAWTALAAWALARGLQGASDRGATVLRVEDIDTPRVVEGSAARILEDLAWLGLDWDEGPIFQSDRTKLYEEALAKLDDAGLTYPCDCSRAEIARAASAPHANEEGREAIYPGTCRDAPRDRPMKRPPATRLRVPPTARVAFDDAVRGRIEEDVSATAGDFVLRRGADDVFAYQLVVAIDDAAMNITHVVRADDLLGSTARQILLMKLLGYASIPTYAHVPLVVGEDGARLAKRARGWTIRDLKTAGVSAEAIVGQLAHGLALVPPSSPRAMTAREVAARITSPETWRRDPWPLPARW